jgi:hypothetical protein
MLCKFHLERAGKSVRAVQTIAGDSMCADCLAGKPILDDERIGDRREDGGDGNRVMRGEIGHRTQTAPEVMAQLRAALSAGQTPGEVAARFGMKLNMVKALRRRMTAKLATQRRAA